MYTSKRMTSDERAAQLWSLLVFAARNQKIISYTMVEQMTGLPRQAVGGILSHIQEYCANNKLPPLQSLVVAQGTGVPGEGFTAAETKDEDIFRKQAKVFVFDWLSIKPVPFPRSQ